MYTPPLATPYGNAKVAFVRGVVAHADRQFETEVWSEGGGGYVGPRGGYVSAAKVRSKTTEHQDIFVREPGGQEFRFALEDWELDVRPGSHLVVGFQGLADNKTKVLRVKNTDTGQDLTLGVWGPWMSAAGLFPIRRTSFWLVLWISLSIVLFTMLAISYAEVRSQASPYRQRSATTDAEKQLQERNLSQREAAWRRLPAARRSVEPEPAVEYRRASTAAWTAHQDEERASQQGAVPWPGLNSATLGQVINVMLTGFMQMIGLGAIFAGMALPLLWIFITWPSRKRHQKLCEATFVAFKRQFDEAFEKVAA